jgi:hypothetical protein
VDRSWHNDYRLASCVGVALAVAVMIANPAQLPTVVNGVELVSKLDEAPDEVQHVIREFWPPEEWDNAAAVSQLESGWNPFAVADTTDAAHPCGSTLRYQNGVRVTAEKSIGLFQINACNLPGGWKAEHLYNSRHNAGTAHDMWTRRGWAPWYFSATTLGLSLDAPPPADA